MRTHHGLYYDSRIKLLLILLTSALAFALGGGLTGLLLFGVVCLFSFLSGLWKTSIKFLTAYIALLMLAQILPIHLSSVITFFLLRILTIPFLFFSKQTLEQYAGMFGESYLGILQTLVSPITAIIMLIVVGLCAFIGAIIAKKLLKKHFQKAGMV